MPEIPHIERAEAAAAASGSMAGLTSGVIMTNHFLPPTVELAPGIEVQPSLTFDATGVEAFYGPGGLHAPNMPADVPPLFSGVRMDITKFDVPLDTNGFETIASLASQYQTGVVDPVQSALTERLLLGGSVGLVVGGFLGHKALQKLQEKGLGERLKTKSRKLLVAAGATLAVAGWTNEFIDGPKRSASDSTRRSLGTNIENRVPELRGASMTGFAAELPRLAADQALEYIDQSKSFWRGAAQSFEAEFDAYQAEGGLDFSTNPNLVPIMQVSDLHCDYAVYDNFTQVLVQKFQPAIIINNGDTYTNAGTMPYEADCFKGFANAVARADKTNESSTTIVNADGNHDTDESQKGDNPKVITLDERTDYSTVVDGIPFVGDGDPTVSDWGETKPEDLGERNKLFASQGSNIAKKACEITLETNKPPIVATHNVAAGFEVMSRGCASIVENGHTHQDGAIQSYQGDNGRTVLQHTVGSASGADGGITIFAKPKQEAIYSMQYFNKLTWQFEAFITVAIDTKENASIKDASKVAKGSLPFTSDNMKTWLDANSKTYSPPTPINYPNH